MSVFRCLFFLVIVSLLPLAGQDVRAQVQLGSTSEVVTVEASIASLQFNTSTMG